MGRSCVELTNTGTWRRELPTSYPATGKSTLGAEPAADSSADVRALVCRPVLRLGSTPSTYTVQAIEGASLAGTEDGAWLVLDLSNGGSFTLPSPIDAAMYRDLVPRDRWIRQTLDKLAWFLTKRFSLRLSIAANHGVEVLLAVHAPEEVLQSGGVEWKAELVETAKLASPPRPAATATAAVPNHAIVSSVVPKQTAGRKKPSTVVFSQPEASASAPTILASDTISMDDNDPPMYPCTKLYLHLVAVRTGVSIPSPAVSNTDSQPAKLLRQLAETVYGSLWDANPRLQDRTYPVHLTLERLYFGAVPRTALTLLPALILMLATGWFLIRPRMLSLLSHTDTHRKME